MQQSPLEQSEEAKRQRDLGGELGALMSGERAMHAAPWYPARVGDLLTVHSSGSGNLPDVEETYEVVEGEYGGMALRLRSHTYSEQWASLAGAYARSGCDPDNPFFEPWMEFGPHTLTIVRDGVVVHDGPGSRS